MKSSIIVLWIGACIFVGALVAHSIDNSLEKYNAKIENTLEKINNEPTENNELNVYVRPKGKEVNYMFGVATAYCPSAKGINSDSNPEVTSTMKPAKEGVIAVNPDVIPYGSEVMIIHENTVIRGQAQDTGGAMRQNNNQVDILMKDLDRAKDWGRKKVHIIWW